MKAISDCGVGPDDGVPTVQAAVTIKNAERFVAAFALLLP